MTEQTTSSLEKKPSRRFRKRTFKRLPPPALAVKPLWEAASEEDKKRAHRQGTTILQLWLGKVTKQQAMAELELPSLRLWQLSQQALSGMLAGLLKQPRTRVKGGAMPTLPEDDPRILRKKIAALEKELATVNRINEVLQMLPGNREKVVSSPKEAKAKRPATKRTSKHGSPRVAATGDRELAAPAPPQVG
jgi:hypothetical protein